MSNDFLWMQIQHLFDNQVSSHNLNVRYLQSVAKFSGPLSINGEVYATELDREQEQNSEVIKIQVAMNQHISTIA